MKLRHLLQRQELLELLDFSYIPHLGKPSGVLNVHNSRSLDKAEVCITRSHHTYQVLAVVCADALWCTNYGHYSFLLPCTLHSTQPIGWNLSFIYIVCMSHWFMWKLALKLKLCVCTSVCIFHSLPSTLFSYPGYI